MGVKGGSGTYLIVATTIVAKLSYLKLLESDRLYRNLQMDEFTHFFWGRSEESRKEAGIGMGRGG